MLTKDERKAVRDGLAPIVFKPMDVQRNPEVRASSVKVRGRSFKLDIYKARAGRDEWGWAMGLMYWPGRDGYSGQKLAWSDHPSPTYAAAKANAEAWLTAYLQPNRDSVLGLLDFVNKADEQLRLLVAEAFHGHTVDHARLRAAYKDLFGKEAEAPEKE